MKIVTAAEMREIDLVTSARFGVPSLTLMENAGTTVADFVASQYPSAKRVGVICGKGNNGGDGFVVARKLHQSGKEVRVLLLAEPAELRGDAAEMFTRLPVPPITAVSHEQLKTDGLRARCGCGHSFWRRRGRDGRAGGRGGASRRSGNFYRSPPRAYFRNAHRRTDDSHSHRLAG